MQPNSPLASCFVFERRCTLSLVVAMFSLGCATTSVASNSAADAARAYRQSHEVQIVSQFREFLRLPNVARNPDDMMRNADWIVRELTRQQFTSEIWTAGGAPYVFAERRFAGASKTLLIYAHFDGQPVQRDNWASPPWQPTLRTALVEDGGRVIDWDEVQDKFDPQWRVFARSAGDDKAPLIALLAALEGLHAAGITPSVNIKLLLDGEEEAGSPTLAAILKAHGDKLSTDLMLFCDGPMHQSRRRQLVFGVRGSMSLDLTTYGATRPLHSGHYGNWAPNPTDSLIRLLASMKNAEGEVTVPGFDDNVRPIDAAERAAIATMPRIDTALAKELALGRTEGNGERLEALVMRPAIIVKGLQGGSVGDASRNIIQPSASASLNLRLVPEQTPASVTRAMHAYLKAQGFHVVQETPTPDVLRAHPRVIKTDWRPGAYPGFRARLDSPQARRLIGILDSIDGQRTLLTPTMGGSLPIYLFEKALDAPILILPIANHDNNQHGRNENLRLQNLWDAIEVYAAALAGYGID